ncbi:putative mannosyl-oligosaccharide 1,3-1,6-alpha-mannosidase [Helianthus annuus]|nr:putative mannosyl-oligosaccharide 1,3-1,6-alpha-mannosidase [Helianthus annuus]
MITDGSLLLRSIMIGRDERRKFIWEEMSYLERWWRDATDAKKEALVRLLQNGQLEIVGGGWVMNDEVRLS